MAVVPGMTELTAPYWEAAREGRLVVQECRSCGRLSHPPLPACPRCHGRDLGWRAVSGTGTVYTYTVVRHPTHFAFAAQIPYAIAVVELAEGPRLLTNLVDVEPDPDALPLDLPVEVRFETAGEAAVPVFRPRLP